MYQIHPLERGSPIYYSDSATMPKEPLSKVEGMATIICTEEQILNMTEIEGVPITVIEARARRGADSECGFLGPEEALIDVLKADWHTVKGLGMTHTQLANMLGQILKSDDLILARFKKKDFAQVSFCAGPSFLPQQLFVEFKCEYPKKLFHMQDDIFRPVTMRCNGMADGTKWQPWNWEYIITNIDNKASLRWTRGTGRYIRRYGFYEGGGEENPYRIDPLKLMFVLTGLSLNEPKAICRDSVD